MRRFFSFFIFSFLFSSSAFAQANHFPALSREISKIISEMPLSSTEAVPVWWNSAVLNDTVLPTERMQKNLNYACEYITKKALTPITASTFAFESIKSLSTIDQKIVAKQDGKRVLILEGNNILKSFSMPEENDCANWSRLIIAALVHTRPFSEKAQKTDAEEFYNIFLNASLALLDSYSHYVGAETSELKELQKPASIGINYRRIGKYLEITEILPNSPASQSILDVKDRIIAINSTPITELSGVEILNLLRGEEDSEVFLHLRKDGKEQNLSLIRKPVMASPVSYFFDEKNRLMTIKIEAFSEKTLESLKPTLRLARQKQAVGLILDLRGNTGGLLKEAVLTADLFLPQNFLVIKTKGRIEETKNQYTSTAKYSRPIYPIAILVDSKTASSAEFFTGVLQEYRHAVVIGTPTFGKGVIQAKETLPDGGELYFTWANYLLPSGFTPQNKGIYPNICTSGKKLLDIDKPIKPFRDIQFYKQGNTSYYQKAIALCPRQSRTDQPFEDELAKQLLLNQKQYENALSHFSLDLAEK